MNAVSALVPAPLEPPFVFDPDEVAKAWFSLSQSQRRLAHKYRQWAEESVTEIERQKWQDEAADYWEKAFWHLSKARQWRDDNA